MWFHRFLPLVLLPGTMKYRWCNGEHKRPFSFTSARPTGQYSFLAGIAFCLSLMSYVSNSLRQPEQQAVSRHNSSGCDLHADQIANQASKVYLPTYLIETHVNIPKHLHAPKPRFDNSIAQNQNSPLLPSHPNRNRIEFSTLNPTFLPSSFNTDPILHTPHPLPLSCPL